VKLLLIACGGATGAVLRYLVSGWGQALTGGTFPVGTLVVNVLGCLVIGFAGTVLAGPLIVRDEYRFFVLIGLLGGFTTFSSFGWETFALLSDREWGAALLNVVASNGLGLAALFIGVRLAERWQGV
jgi:fluoride exporter